MHASHVISLTKTALSPACHASERDSWATALWATVLLPAGEARRPALVTVTAYRDPTGNIVGHRAVTR